MNEKAEHTPGPWKIWDTPTPSMIQHFRDDGTLIHIATMGDN